MSSTIDDRGSPVLYQDCGWIGGALDLMADGGICPCCRTRPARIRSPREIRLWACGVSLRTAASERAAEEPVTTGLDALLAKAKDHVPIPEETEAQRQSFVYGNTKLSNDRITREHVARAAEASTAPRTKLGPCAVDAISRHEHRPLGHVQVPSAARDTRPDIGEVSESPEAGPYTRAQFAAAVDEAHAALHEAEEFVLGKGPRGSRRAGVAGAIDRAHEALHRVGAGQPRVECATPNPEAQKILSDLLAMRDREIPCGHTIADLIYGAADTSGLPPVTRCGACLAARQATKAAASERAAGSGRHRSAPR